MAEGHRRQGDIHDELRLQTMSEIGAGGAHGKITVGLEKGAFLGRGRLGAGGTGNDRGMAALDAGLELFPGAGERSGDRARLALGAVGDDAGEFRQRLGAARFGMRPGFDYQEGADRAEREAGVIVPLPYRGVCVLQAVAAELIKHQQIGAFAVIRAADQRNVALSGLDARERHAHGVDAGGLLAHEGARGAGDAMHDRDVAGEQIGQLREEEGGAQAVHQLFVDVGLGVAGLGRAAQHRAVDREVALTAASGDDHVDVREHVGVAFDPGALERETGGVGADALPSFHLALIALLGNLRVEIDRGQGVHDEGCETGGVGFRLRGHQLLPMGVRPLAEAGDDTDAGDPGLAGGVSHWRAPRCWAVRCWQRCRAFAGSFRRSGTAARGR